VIENLVDPVVWLSGLVWIKQMPLELFSFIDPRKNRLTKELDISSHLKKLEMQRWNVRPFGFPIGWCYDG
jgi:hypothetical protein